MRVNETMHTRNKHGVEFSDDEVASYVMKHLRLRDFFHPDRIAKATLIAFDVFLDEGEIVSKKKNWKFFENETKLVWKDN